MIVENTGRLLYPVRNFVHQIRTNFGPSRLFLPGRYFVGIDSHPLKYYWPLPKKPNQKYGIQGVNHLLPYRGIVYKNLPAKVKLKKGLIYTWCNCGRSDNQPFCDGTHNRLHATANIHPVRYIPEKDEEVWLCQCKQSNNRPFCDGTHRNLTSNQLKLAREIAPHVPFVESKKLTED